MALKTNTIAVTKAWTEISDGAAGNLKCSVQISYRNSEPIVVAVATGIGDLSADTPGHFLTRTEALVITLESGNKMFARTVGLKSQLAVPENGELIITRQ